MMVRAVVRFDPALPMLAVAGVILAALAGSPDAHAQTASSRAATARPTMPSFVDSRHVPDLIAARGEASVAASAALVRDAEARLLSDADDLARRAEEERALAADVRARAEALSERFATEMAQEDKAERSASPERTAAGAKPPAAAQAAVQGTGQSDRTASTMKRAAESLARARKTLDEADRKAAAGTADPAGWGPAQVEIAAARREAAEAVARAEQALGAAPPVTAEAEGSVAGAAGSPTRAKRMTPPFALGATLR